MATTPQRKKNITGTASENSMRANGGRQKILVQANKRPIAEGRIATKLQKATPKQTLLNAFTQRKKKNGNFKSVNK